MSISIRKYHCMCEGYISFLITHNDCMLKMTRSSISPPPSCMIHRRKEEGIIWNCFRVHSEKEREKKKKAKQVETI